MACGELSRRGGGPSVGVACGELSRRGGGPSVCVARGELCRRGGGPSVGVARGELSRRDCRVSLARATSAVRTRCFAAAADLALSSFTRLDRLLCTNAVFNFSFFSSVSASEF